jgi:Protein of unknown function (DUF5674)
MARCAILPQREARRYPLEAMSAAHKILVTSKKLDAQALKSLIGAPFPDMVKFVVDIQTRKIAIGGAMHVDAEAELLAAGSAQEHLWGGNYYPGKGSETCVEFTSLINIRPAQNSRFMEVRDPLIRRKMIEIVHALVGKGEPLA